jgi:hypothetical protein
LNKYFIKFKNDNPKPEPKVNSEVEPEVIPHVEPEVIPHVESDIEPGIEPDVIPHVESDIEPDIEPDVIPHVEPNNLILRKLYKKLSLLTHPDKKGGNSEVFNTITDAYKNENLLTLFIMAKSHGLDFKEYYIKELNKNLLEKDIEDLNNSISNIKQKLAWVWGKAGPEQQDLLKKQFNL